MHPAAAAFSRSLDRFGERVTLRRAVANAAPVDVTVRARVTGYSPEELASGVMQGQRKALLSAADVAASGFPLPLRQGSTDSIIAHGSTMKIVSVDDSTRRVGDELIAYALGLTG